MRRSFVALVALAALAGAFPASAEVTPGDVAAARDRLRQVTERLAGEVAAYDAALSTEAALRDRLDRLFVDLTARERALVLARRAARDRAAEMYMAAGSVPPVGITTSEVDRLPTRYVYLESVSQTDRELLNRLEASRRDYEQQRVLVEEAVADQEGLATEMERLVGVIYGELDAANQEYQAVREQWEAQEAERRRREAEERARQEFLATSTTTSRPTTTTTGPTTTTTRPTTTTVVGATTTTGPSTTVPITTTVPATTPTTAGTTTTFASSPAGTRACPVDGATTFTDSWGDPRPGGRAHKGVDLLASSGTPLVAIEAGYIWYPNWHSDGGLGLYIRGDSGDLWYYAHLSAYAPGVVGGLRVEAGQRVGFVGSTGNASVPHLHLGWQPGGGAYANPYPIVRALC